MGIRGLTTFIQNRSHLYLEEYELYNTNIVIDGNAIACQLYKWHCKSNDCFGGDYDKYAAAIENFFQILSSCNVTPYVVFDGGYERRKVTTVISRMKNKIKSAQKLNSATEGSISVFPLFLRETFQDIVLKLNIKCVRCDFESDTEIANIARTLNCPVLSYDSDFFIFDVFYVPFSTVEMCTRKKKKTDWNEPYTYIYCKVYKVEKFLKSFGGLDKSNLPILAVLLGNDYVKRSAFSMFYKNLKIQKSHGNQNDQQKRIKSVIVWLQNESIESAVQKVLSRYKCTRRKLIANKIRTAIKGYNCTDSAYLPYLEIPPVNSKETVQMCLDINCIEEESIQDDDLDYSESHGSDSEEDSSSTNEDVDVDLSFDKNEQKLDIPTVFLEKFRKCLYPPSFMDILIQNKYYCIPQVENDALEYSHAISTEILSAIQAILRNSGDHLMCVTRSNNDHVKKVFLPTCDIDLPSLIEIENTKKSSRKNLFLQILKIEGSFIENCLNSFPQSWHLFIITIKYLVDKSVITWPVVYALIMCKIYLGYVNKRIGPCHSKKAFEKKLSVFQSTANNNKETNNSLQLSLIDALENINYNDSMVCLKKLFSYFQFDAKLKTNYRLYDRNIVHLMAQFQSCLLHIKYLNILLNSPFANSVISDFFNGTFIYNLSTNFMKRSNLDNYVTLLLQDSPTVLSSFKLVIEKLKEHLNAAPCDVTFKKRKKRKKQKEVDVMDYREDFSEEEVAFDPNNKYSVLLFSEKNC